MHVHVHVMKPTRLSNTSTVALCLSNSVTPVMRRDSPHVSNATSSLGLSRPELLFIIHWWLFIAEHQHLRCSVCPVFACRASLAALFSQKLNRVCGGKQRRARRTGVGWVFHQNTASVFPPHHSVRFEWASSLFRCQCSNYLCCE